MGQMAERTGGIKMIHNEYPCGLKIHIDHEKGIRIEDFMTCPLHSKTCPKLQPQAPMPGYYGQYPEIKPGGKPK